MKRIVCSVVACLTLAAFHFRTVGAKAEPAAGSQVSAPATVVVSRNYATIPLHFEPNTGQVDAGVKFVARASDHDLFLTSNEAVLVLDTGLRREASGQDRHAHGHGLAGRTPATLRMRVVGANTNPTITGEAELPGKSNYLLGNDPAKWRTSVTNFAKVRYADVYPGISLVYHGTQQRLEYDFVISPRVDYRKIRLSFAGATNISLDRDGNLVLRLSDREIIQPKPVVYQEGQNPFTTRTVRGRYVLLARHEVGFAVDDYDRSKTLVIDPVLPLLGGGGDDAARSIAVDSTGAIYITGESSSGDFPTTTGVFQTTLKGSADAFVTKLDPTGSSIVYSTYFGGRSGETGWGIAVDASGRAFVTGGTNSSDFPLVVPTQPTMGGPNNNPSTNPIGDAFVSVLNPTGTQLLFSTYLGGRDYDEGFGIGVDASSNAWITGTTVSLDWPFEPRPGNPLLFKQVFGGVSHAFVVKIMTIIPVAPAFPPTIAYSTLFGGSAVDRANGLTLDAAGNAYIAGDTASADFPTTPGAFQPQLRGANNVFVAKFPSNVSSLATGLPTYSTFLGGTLSDFGFSGGNMIVVDPTGNAYVTGGTMSSNFPVTAGAFQTENLALRSKAAGRGGRSNIFVTKLNPAGTALVYSTYLGGTATTFDPVTCRTNGGDQDHGHAIAVDGAGNAWVTGGAVTPGAPWVEAGAPWPTATATPGLTAAACATIRAVTLGADAPTWWRGFPVTSNALQPDYGGASYDVFVTEFNPAGSALLYSTFLGGSNGEDMGHGIAAASSGRIWVTGFTNSPNFPLGRPSAFDGFIIGFQGAPVSANAKSECFFNWAERNYPNDLVPGGQTSQSAAPYYYRFYPGTNAYLATSSADNRAYYLGPLSGNRVLDLGPLSTWLTSAGCPQ